MARAGEARAACVELDLGVGERRPARGLDLLGERVKTLDQAGGPEQDPRQCADRAAELAHRAGRLDTAADDVADHDPDRPLRDGKVSYQSPPTSSVSTAGRYFVATWKRGSGGGSPGSMLCWSVWATERASS